MPHIGRYRVIVADIPWAHQNYGQAKHGAAKSHYTEMPLDDVAIMPVADLAHLDGCLLFLWCTGPQAADGAHREIAAAWGFELKTRPFAWVKIGAACVGCDHPHDEHDPGPVSGAFVAGGCERASCECPAFAAAPSFGPGAYTGGNVEDVWLGVRGRAAWSRDRARRDMRQVVFAPTSGHSRKPEAVQDRIEALWPEATPRLELFARRRREGWACWGAECPEPDLVFGAHIGAAWPVAGVARG